MWVNFSTTLEDTRDSKCDRSTQGSKCTYFQSEGGTTLPIDLANGPLGQASFHKWTACIICKAVKYAVWLMVGTVDL